MTPPRDALATALTTASRQPGWRIENAAFDADAILSALAAEGWVLVRQNHAHFDGRCAFCTAEHAAPDPAPLDATVCEVCGKLADGEPGRCHLHFRHTTPTTADALRAAWGRYVERFADATDMTRTSTSLVRDAFEAGWDASGIPDFYLDEAGQLALLIHVAQDVVRDAGTKKWPVNLDRLRMALDELGALPDDN